jgi:hypothetical protein
MLENRTQSLLMDMTKIELEKAFDKKVPELVSALETWFDEEAAPIDGVEPDAPSGDGGSIIAMRPAIDSKRVVDATAVTKKFLGIPLPPAIIKPGGYTSCSEMIDDIVPKLKKVFTGEIKANTPKPVKQPEPA